VLPEYDQPRVLVIVRGELPTDTVVPLTATLRVPKDANVTNTCSLKGDEEVCTTATSRVEGEEKVVTYDLANPGLYVEYYYSSFTGAGPRTADFSFWPPFPAASLEVAIPAPTDATDFDTVPPPARTANDSSSKHYIYEYQDVTADQPINLTLSYSRPTDEPWAPAPQSENAQAAADPNEDGGLPSDAILFLALAAALAVAFIGYNTVGRRVRFDMGLTQDPGTAEGHVPGGRPAVMYCRTCGAPSRRTAGYCSSCGSELRAATVE
jgi:hypothetical protein